MLKQDYKEGEMTLKTALALAIKVLNKTMDVSKLSAEKGERSPHGMAPSAVTKGRVHIFQMWLTGVSVVTTKRFQKMQQCSALAHEAFS